MSRKPQNKLTPLSEDPKWEDVIPIPQEEGSAHPLASIAYAENYSEAMDYLRAVMATNEMSERVLELTERVIRMNPAHYTVWLYRARTLFTLNHDLYAEIAWLNPTALRHQKNYQIWHHRQTLINALDSADGEIPFLTQMFEKDSKNYHVWSYRQWLVKRFDLWDAGEIESVEELLKKDVRNNSAWNHRWFVVFGRPDTDAFKDEEIVKREIEFAKSQIRLAPQNQSPWSYLRGIIRQASLPLSSLREFAEEFAVFGKMDQVRSSHALALVADIYAEEPNGTAKATLALDMLAIRYDPIRVNYWEYKKKQLPPSSPVAAGT
ncbi:protein prenylyltransferase [Aulographum hederae CBS 113979]|uniref:Protein farnesyltransferase/geranylgeranyltransferase type-1 subunit alpha n=1 Tax=Aulographum hederae CBS 113979 TaxID=1176131 RepID=A0A6G1H3V2_9PEZI|nr:protein prenylyltransferase [Aulographum hederae CBS 113979]